MERENVLCVTGTTQSLNTIIGMFIVLSRILVTLFI